MNCSWLIPSFRVRRPTLLIIGRSGGRSGARGQGGDEAAADQGLTLLIHRHEIALDELLAVLLELPRDRPSADHVVARPRARGEAHLVAAHAGPAREPGDH